MRLVVIIILSTVFVICSMLLCFCRPKTLKHFKLLSLNGTIDNHDYEVDEQLALIRVLRKGDRVLQLGGNIGTSCITASIAAKLDTNVCVEPCKELYDILEKNSRDYAVSAIHGVIGECTSVRLQNMDTANNHWGAFTSKDGSGEETPCHSLNSIRPQRGFSVLFADCEGCLPEFLEEYQNVLGDLRAIIYERDRAESVNYEVVDDFLRRNRFSCQAMDVSNPFHFICSK